MNKIFLGSTDLLVSRVGLGTVKFGRNQNVKYPNHFDLPDDASILDLLAFANELGINFLDTAPAYGVSEVRLGKLLKNRKQWNIATKVGEHFVNGESHFDFTAQGTEKSILSSLKNLNTDYLDLVLIHSNGDDKNILEKEAVFETLIKLKKTGIIRAIGISSKTIEGGILAASCCDVVMVTYNPVENAEKEVIDLAHKNKRGVLIKKALVSGHLKKINDVDPVKETMQFIFKHPGVSSVIVGTINKKHLLQNVMSAQVALDETNHLLT